jgi:hypothetical protein
MARTIPQIRDRLHAIATDLEVAGFAVLSGELHGLAEETRRLYHGRRAPVRSRKLTDELAARIRDDAWAHPTEHQEHIARRHGVVGGRVSEALYGKRG